MSILSWLKRKSDFLIFKLYHPTVPVVEMGRIGTINSQDGQDLYLIGLLFGKLKLKPGIVVDIGCNHPIKYSNSLAFEDLYKCQVLAVDAIDDFRKDWEVYRPKSEFVSTALSDKEGRIQLYVPESANGIDNMFSSTGRPNPKVDGSKINRREVGMTTLAQLFRERQISSVLLLSIDVEGAEKDVLQGVDFSKAYINCIVLENNETSYYGSNDVRFLLKSKGFQFVARLGCLDDVYININQS
jgi:FkbM family methyltransferase